MSQSEMRPKIKYRKLCLKKGACWSPMSQLYDALGPKKQILRTEQLLLELVNGHLGRCSLAPMILMFSGGYHLYCLIKSQSVVEPSLDIILLQSWPFNIYREIFLAVCLRWGRKRERGLKKMMTKFQRHTCANNNNYLFISACYSRNWIKYFTYIIYFSVHNSLGKYIIELFTFYI